MLILSDQTGAGSSIALIVFECSPDGGKGRKHMHHSLSKKKIIISFLLTLLFLPCASAQESSGWSEVPSSQIQQGRLAALPGMQSLDYKMACPQIGRHCSATVELSWTLKDGTKKSQFIFEEMADGLSSVRVKNKQVILKVAYWANGDPLAKNDYLKWTNLRFKWKKNSNSFARMN